MKVDYCGNEYLLGWKHEINEDQTGKTICYLRNENGVTFEATAHCVSPDKYDRKIGRKLSLQRLTKMMKKTERRYVWGKVLSQVNI